MRIVGGAWRGRRLTAPPGQGTRPTADRVRQALFDMLMHAPWGDRSVIEDAVVLDVFAGTGAMGLEALSRGAASAWFFERDPAALKALRANIGACGAGQRAHVTPGDVMTMRLPPVRAALVFLDPPYDCDLVPMALGRLVRAGLLVSGALVVAEIGVVESWRPEAPLLAERTYGAARVLVFRHGDGSAEHSYGG